MTMTSTTVKKQRLSKDYVITHLRTFYKVKPNMTFNRFCKEKNIKRSNLGKIWNASGLGKMKEASIDVATAMERLTTYLENQNLQHSAKMKYLHKSNEVMTEDEVNLVVNLAKILGSMGHGIDSSICLAIVNSVVRCHFPSKNYVSITSSVVERMLKNHSEVIRLVHGNSIDPARIRQADVEVRDTQFYKIESFIGLLYKMGNIP